MLEKKQLQLYIKKDYIFNDVYQESGMDEGYSKMKSEIIKELFRVGVAQELPIYHCKINGSNKTVL